jgi:hypothetical protein
MMDSSHDAAAQHDSHEDGDHGAVQGPQSLKFVIIQVGQSQQWRVGVLDPATNAIVHYDMLNIEQANRRVKFVDALLERLHLPEGEVAEKRATFLAALESEVAKIIQDQMSAVEDDGLGGAFPGDPAPAIVNFTKVLDKNAPQLIGMMPPQIADQLFGITGGFPKRVGDRLFAVDSDHEVVEFGSPNILFAWMRRRAQVIWEKGPSLMTPEQFYAHLAMTAEAFDGLEVLPHYPPLPGIYYAHPPFPAEAGGLLDELLGRFNPATDADRELIRALILTPFWGGEPGSRPAFLVTGPEDDADLGRGVGKSKLTDIIACDLAGGLLEVTPKDDIPSVKTRLLSQDAARKRVIRLDNVKNRKFAWSDLEAVITTPVISGKALYRGEGQRPNTLTWILTLNNAGLGKDLAQRVIPIKLARPQFDANWEKNVRRFIGENRTALIGEIIALLQSEGAEFDPRTRWAAWEQGVLGKTKCAAECQRLILERQREMDVDEGESEEITDFMASSLRYHGHDPETEVIRIRGPVVCAWLAEVTGEPITQTNYKRKLAELNLPRLRPYKNDGFKGYLWTGAKARPSAPVKELRIPDYEEPLDPEQLELFNAHV